MFSFMKKVVDPQKPLNKQHSQKISQSSLSQQKSKNILKELKELSSTEIPASHLTKIGFVQGAITFNNNSLIFTPSPKEIAT